MRITNFLTGIQGVGAGNVATLDIPVARRYHALKIFVSGTFNSAASTNPVELITSARLLVNGTLIRDLLPADIINIAALNNITAQASNGELPFYFSEPWRASVIGEEVTSWDLALQKKCTLEITFNSVSVTGSYPITNLAVAAVATFDYGRNVDQNGNPLNNIVKQLRYSLASLVGATDIGTLPTQFPIQRVHFRVSSGSISSIIVTNNGAKVMEGLTAQLTALYKDYKVIQSAYAISAIFDYTQQISDALLPQNNNVNFQPVCSAAGTITAVAELRSPGFY